MHDLKTIYSLKSQLGAFCERSLAIRNEVLGKAHPDTAGSIFTLARVLTAQVGLDFQWIFHHPKLQKAVDFPRSDSEGLRHDVQKEARAFSRKYRRTVCHFGYSDAPNFRLSKSKHNFDVCEFQ